MEGTTAPSTALALPTLPSASLSGGLLDRGRAFASRPGVARLMPAVSVVGLAGVAALAWALLSTPPQRALVPGASDSDKAAIAEALTGGGIEHHIDSATGAITVADADYYRARMAIAQQGLPRGASGADDVIASLPMGASRAVEGERLRSAREQDLARTIEAIDGVESARVHLALAEPSAFVRARRQSAASVMLVLAGGRSLSDSQTQAIIHLVASSVPDMAPDAVSIVDQRGGLLSRNGVGAGERQLAERRAIEEDYRRALTALLTPLVGADNFTAEVNADLDFAEVQSTREGFPQEAAVVSSEQSELSTEGGDIAPAGGIPGALANQPPPQPVLEQTPPDAVTADAGAMPTAQGRRMENHSRNYVVGREISVSRQQTPSLRRLSVAVVLRSGAGETRAADLSEIERLVKSAVGFDAERGDVVAVAARRFVSTTADPAPWWESDWFALLTRQGVMALAVILLVFGIGRPLLRHLFRREKTTTDVPPIAIVGEASGEEPSPVTIDMIDASRGYEDRAALIRDFVRQDPARAALVVRDLIRSGTGGRHDG